MADIPPSVLVNSIMGKLYDAERGRLSSGLYDLCYW